MKLNFIFSMLLTATFCSTAFGGQTQPAEVDVDFVNMIASGDQLTARVDIDDDVFIGCGVRRIEDGAGGIFHFGFCQAEDDEGDNVTCFTQNPDLLDALDNIDSYSFITFSWSDDGAGNLTCNRIGVSTQSFYLPKGLKGN